MSAPAHATPETPDVAKRSRLGSILGWAGKTRFRLIALGATAVAGLIGGFAAYSYLTQTAVEQIDQPSLAQALFAYDENRMEDAREIVEKMAHESRPELFGGSLFVLGAVKAHEADLAPEDRRRSLHAIAARYLQKARTLGVPERLNKKAKYLHARSLILGQEGKLGALLLHEISADGDSPGPELDALLVKAYLFGADPQWSAALTHVDRYLSSQPLDRDGQRAMQTQRVKILASMGRVDEARESLASYGVAEDDPERMLIAGRLDVEAAEKLSEDSPEFNPLVLSARKALEGAESGSPQGGQVARESSYWLGKLAALEGNEVLARELFGRLSQLHSDAPEGFAAQLEVAELEQSTGRSVKALDDYRVLLESVTNLQEYRNELIPLAALRARLQDAFQNFVGEQLFGEAETFIEQLAPAFDQLARLQMRAELHKRWGDAFSADADRKGPWKAPDTQRAARRQYRAAGVAYEAVARLRFATRMFPDDLWNSSENFFLGQSYSNAARMIEEYLRHEVRHRGAAALLRLGQCRLAANRLELARAAFEECLEAYPDDIVSFRVRLEFARAEQKQAHFERAKELLAVNLRGDLLAPESPDWRDSLFELGRILYESGDFDEAIIQLEEAVARYPDADAAILARYTIARANHASAQKPAANLLRAKTDNERQKSRTQMIDYLTAALKAYETVQRIITLGGQSEASPLHRSLLRNCYMMQGAVLYELNRYNDAQQAFANVSNMYQNDPFVLESYVQMANCWRHLEQPVKARGTIRLARNALENMPASADFLAATNFSKQQWQFVLDSMYTW